MFKKPIYPTVRQHRQIYVPKKKGPKQIWVPKVNMWYMFDMFIPVLGNFMLREALKDLTVNH